MHAIGSHRNLSNTSFGSASETLSSKALRSRLANFTNGSNDHMLHSAFKDHVMMLAVDSITRQQNNISQSDELEGLKKAFNILFYPKKLLGIMKQNNQPILGIDCGTYVHDIDLLSDGERELSYILGSTQEFGKLENIVLWDTPEAHLNASLEGRLLDAIRLVGPNNQYWLASHSLDIIDSVDSGSIVVLDDVGGEVKGGFIDENRSARLAVFEDLGARVGIQIASKKLVFVEGGSRKAEKDFLENIYAMSHPGLSFVAGGDASSVIQLGSKTSELLSSLESDADFAVIIDRDYNADDEVDRLVGGNSNIFVWPVHEFENVLLEPRLAAEVLRAIGAPMSNPTEALQESARLIREWVAADWSAWTISQRFKQPKRFISETSPLDSLQEYFKRLSDAFNAFSEEDSAGLMSRHLVLVDAAIESGDFIKIVPGKQLLHSLLQHTKAGVKRAQYLGIAASLVSKDRDLAPMIQNLDDWIERGIV